MVVLKLNEIYKYDRISENNEEAWLKLIQKLSTYHLDDEFEIYFGDIVVSHGFCSPEFLKLLAMAKKMKRLVFKFKNSEKNKINMEQIILLNGLEEKAFVENIPLTKVVYIDERLEEQKRIEQEAILERIYDTYSKMLNYNNGVVEVSVVKAITQISSANTYNNMKIVIEKYMRELNLPITCVFIDFEGVVLMKHMVSEIYEHVKQISELYDVDINGIDNYTLNNINKYKIMDKIPVELKDEKSKFKFFMDKLKIGSMGILISYKHSKTMNEFGMYGDGDINFTRICMVQAYEPKSCSIVFRVYKRVDFKTKEQLESEERETELKYYLETIKIDEIGYMNDFLGSNYHYINAVQHYNNQGEMELYDVLYTDDNGELIEDEVCMPHLIRIVMNNHNEKYNEALLDECIKATEQIISEGDI